MSKRTVTRSTTIALSLFAAALLLGGCVAPVETYEGEEGSEEEIAETDEAVGESEEALKHSTGSGGGGGHCGYFCPWWAKDLSDCLLIPCDDVYAP